jgi:hypothetical protein
VARWELAEQFGQTSTPEAQWRGLDEAPVVVSPNDGATWIQGLLALVAPQAVRILDFPHAVEHLSAVAALVYGEGTADARAWVAAQQQALHHAGPHPLFAALALCQARGPCSSARVSATGQTPTEQLAREVAYFTTRIPQLTYPHFRHQGDPIGSGIVESGHKVVIAPRCKRAGQHWASQHRNPLLALRWASCNDRWATTWAAVWAEQCRRAAVVRQQAQRARRPTPPAPAPPLAPVAAALPRRAVPPRPKLVVNGRPTAAHPWRRFAFGAARRPGG